MPMRILGWNTDHCTYLEHLYAIMYEELYGLAACIENVEYLLYMPDDALNYR